MNNQLKKLRVGVIGGTGYTGAELLRLLATHPFVSLEVITSRAEKGQRVTDIFPSLDAFKHLQFSDVDPGAFSACDVVFSATPNGVAMQYAQDIIAAGTVLIDLAADFRLSPPGLWEQWYGQAHLAPKLLDQAVYGLPEIFRKKIKSAKLIANPGCYPTASLLGAYPLVVNGLLADNALIIDAKSGVTGAGRGANVATLFSEVNDSFKAYAASGHRHHPEISQILAQVSPEQHAPTLTFVPHLVPMLRGIHATIYVDLKDASMSLEALHSIYKTTYKDEPFVDVLTLGQHPETRTVKGANMCRIGLHKATGSNKLVVLSVIDNLTKGAAGQAIQNMNLCFNLPETTGLTAAAMLP